MDIIGQTRRAGLWCLVKLPLANVIGWRGAVKNCTAHLRPFGSQVRRWCRMGKNAATDYFPLLGWQVHLSAGLLQPEHTLFLISRPHFLHGEQPQLWHIAVSFVTKSP